MSQEIVLPGLDCGACGAKTCEEFRELVARRPELLKRCVHLSRERVHHVGNVREGESCEPARCRGCATSEERMPRRRWVDSLGREFDFVLDVFPDEPGPRETIKLHNPQLVRELDVRVGDVLIGRPLGMSCGCPITHCGTAMQVDQRTGIIVWCVTGPLQPRQRGYKDLGYYSAEAYEGLVREWRVELKVGMRYWFMPHKCMLQWRHSGLVNFLNKVPGNRAYQVRLEGLLIG